MKHPDEAALALFAGHDLGFVSEWRTRRHVARCEQCRAAVEGFASLRSQLVDLGELPADLGWNKLAAEMKANIRLGIAAGECVAGTSELAGASKKAGFTGVHTLLAYASLLALVVVGVWMERPTPPLAQLAPAVENSGTVLAANGDGIELTEGGRGLGFRYGASRDVNYSADASGAMGARYVDKGTGVVTVVTVNLE
jgi:hypothetical protein